MKGKKERFYQNNQNPNNNCRVFKNSNINCMEQIEKVEKLDKLKSRSDLNLEKNNRQSSNHDSLSKDFVLRPIPIDLRSYKLKSNGDGCNSSKKSKDDMNDSLIDSVSSKNNSKKEIPQVQISNSSIVFVNNLSVNLNNVAKSMGGSLESKETDDTSPKCLSSLKSIKKDITIKDKTDLDNFLMLDLEDKDIPVMGDGFDLNIVNYLQEDDYIYDNSIRIIKYISEGAQAKIYLGLIEEINKYVAIKRYTLPKYDKEIIDKITKEFETIKNLENEHSVKYFDVDYTTESEHDVKNYYLIK